MSSPTLEHQYANKREKPWTRWTWTGWTFNMMDLFSTIASSHALHPHLPLPCPICGDPLPTDAERVREINES